MAKIRKSLAYRDEDREKVRKSILKVEQSIYGLTSSVSNDDQIEPHGETIYNTLE
jgi:hypothetical protein